jgi:hypothetical protein
MQTSKVGVTLVPYKVRFLNFIVTYFKNMQLQYYDNVSCTMKQLDGHAGFV